jgi:hypothetical protein
LENIAVTVAKFMADAVSVWLAKSPVSAHDSLHDVPELIFTFAVEEYREMLEGRHTRFLRLTANECRQSSAATMTSSVLHFKERFTRIGGDFDVQDI